MSEISLTATSSFLKCTNRLLVSLFTTHKHLKGEYSATTNADIGVKTAKEAVCKTCFLSFNVAGKMHLPAHSSDRIILAAGSNKLFAFSSIKQPFVFALGCKSHSGATVKTIYVKPTPG